MLTPATDYLYIKPSLIALSQNIFEETKDDSWEIDSDQLNTSFDSDSELTSKDQNYTNSKRQKNLVRRTKLTEKTQRKGFLPSISTKELNRRRVDAFSPKTNKKPKGMIPRAIPYRADKRLNRKQTKDSLSNKKSNNSSKSSETKDTSVSKSHKDSNYTRVSRQGRKFKIEADTNVMAIDLNALSKSDYTTSSKPILCKGCKAVFNMYSKVSVNDLDDQVWTCEFCDHSNKVSIFPDEIPMNKIIDYELNCTKNKHAKTLNQPDSAIVFCIDTSSSMNSCDIDTLPFIVKSNDEADCSSSSINLIKQAIISQLDLLKKSSKIISLITFSTSVTCYGSCDPCLNDNQPNIINSFCYVIKIINFNFIILQIKKTTKHFRKF